MTRQDGERIGVWGRSGSGKTTWVRFYLEGRKRVVIFDPQGDYQGKVVIDHDSPDALDRVRQEMARDPAGFVIVYRPPAGKEARALDYLAAMIWRGQASYRAGQGGAPVTLVVDEMNLSFPVHGGDANAPNFANICSRGRAAGITVVGVSQGIAEVSTRFRRNCSQVVVFAQADHNDRRAAAQALYVTPGEIDDLPKFHYLHRADDQVKRRRLKKPKKT